ncbi:hypothetical protein A2363_02690 [Candidatus Gottesmanbacteria bacterium RIFOXYB1_FULL_47_11]|uniref:Beta-lactamase class A catalytic domain-containing protein n=1 Tax=Candidatus Gottesmanbacteria bacterium RIFOXYB1_FULL_47_11 TaxID=1798401 RepID=A0A1F6BEJ3_9BACT|nr:MAG: hypothetical protein A2363_02690 [Candidatus Gottesmanbacteria bacterium RIFOXYB1_FULL_47_11]
MRAKWVVFLIFIAAVTSSFVWVRETRRPVISPLQEGSYKKILSVFTVRKDPLILKKKVQETIDNTWNNYSVYVVDFNSNFTMGINENEIFTAASVNKLPIMAAVYYKAQKGEVNFDQIVTLQPEDIQDYGTGSIRYDAPGTTYSVKTLMRLMMQKSDNTAAFLLGNYIVELPAIQSIISEWGLTQTDMVNNKASNHDMYILLNKIYGNNITNAALTAEMLGFMRDSDFEDRLPGELPKEATVYHKIGTGDGGIIHDVGIVVNGKTAYYVGIMTADIPDPENAAKLEAKVSKIIYDFMN